MTGSYRVAEEFFFFNNFQNSQGSCACQLVAPECGAELKMLWLDMRSDDDASNRKAIAHSFSHRVNVGVYAGEVMAKEFTASSKAASRPFRKSSNLGEIILSGMTPLPSSV